MSKNASQLAGSNAVLYSMSVQPSWTIASTVDHRHDAKLVKSNVKIRNARRDAVSTEDVASHLSVRTQSGGLLALSAGLLL
jgi:hypothetical protein